MPTSAARPTPEDTADAPAAASPLRLALDGVPRLLDATGRERPAGTRKALALALLVVLDAGLSRARAADLLWPGAPATDARRNLRRDLFRLRQLGLDLAEGGERLALRQPVRLLWPGAGTGAPRWLDGLDDVAGAEFADWAEEQRGLLQRRWLEHLQHQARGTAHVPAEGPVHGAADEAPAPSASAPSASAPAAGASRPMPPRGSLPFVGRQAERAALQAAAARRQRVLLDGVPGIGKTRLALEALAEVGDGVLVLRCRPEDAVVPYASALRALAALREAAPELELPARTARDLAALDATQDTTPGGPPLRAGHDTAPELPGPERLREAFADAVQRLAAGNFGALLIDDWQWADEASQGLWEPTPTRAAAALPCVFAHRSGELPPAALERRRRWLDQGLAVSLHLGPLDAADARALLAALQSTAPGPAADAAPAEADTRVLLERGAGHPLFLVEHWRQRQAQGSLTGTPTSVQELLVARSRALGPLVRRVLELASLVDDELPPALLAAVLGLDELAVVQALEHAEAAELLVADRRGRQRIAHDLIAQAIAGSLAPVRRAALHAALAGALAERGAEPGRVAWHFAQAGRDAECAHWQRRAAEVAVQRHAWGAAQAALDAALALGRDAAERLAAHLLAARVQHYRADVPAAESSLQQAMTEAARLGPTAVIDVALAQAELHCEIGRAAEALPALDFLSRDPALDDTRRSVLMTLHANALALLGRHAESLPLLRRLREELPPSALHRRWRVQTRLVRNLYFAGEREALRTELQAALALAQQLGDESHIADMTYKLGVIEREQGRIEAALGYLEAAIAMARRIGDVERLRAALATLSTIRLDRMELDAAEAAIEEGERALPGWGSIVLEDIYAHRRHRLHMLRGELAEAWTLTLESLRRNLNHSHLHCVLASDIQAVRLALAEGDAATARHHFGEGQRRHTEAGAESLHGHELDAVEVEVLNAEGRHAEAVQAARHWLAAEREARVDDIAPLLAAAVASAAACGELAQARAWWARAEALPVICLSTQAALLAARRALVQADPEAGEGERAAAEAAIAAWLALPRRPALAERHLRSPNGTREALR